MSKPKTADRLDKLELLLEKLVESGGVKSSKGKAKQKPSKLYFEPSTWKGEDRLLIYTNGKPIEGKFSKFQASFNRDSLQQILDSSDVQNFLDDA